MPCGEMPVLHPRCGTRSPGLSPLVAALFHALVLPLAAGLGHEAFGLARRLPSSWPLGYLFQRLTLEGPPRGLGRRPDLAGSS